MTGIAVFYLISGFFTRLLLLTSFTILFGGFGFILILSLFNNVISGTWTETIVVSITLGLAFSILAMIGISALNIPITRANLLRVFFGINGILVVLGGYKFRRGAIRISSFVKDDLKEVLIFVAFLFLLISVRTAQINDLLVPNWVDGFIHTTLLQKLVSKGTIPIDQIYHNGFYAIAILVFYILRLSLPETILLLGQWLSAVCGIAFYIMIRKYFRSLSIVYFSLALYSLFLFFPSYLVSWGRYPFLLGLTLLPPTIAISQSWIEGGKGNYFMALIYVAALGLVHYGSFLIWVAFIVLDLIYKLVDEFVRHTHRKFKTILFLRPFLLISPLLLFFIPKALNLWNHQSVLENIVLRANDANLIDDDLTTFGLILDHDYFLFIFWITGLMLSSIWKKRSFWQIFLWPFTGWIMIWMQYRFLGISISNYKNLIIFSSMPFALSFGQIANSLILNDQSESVLDNSITSTLSKLASPVLWIIILISLGVFINSQVIYQYTVLFTREDQRAMTWIRANTPQNSIFFIRSFVWGDTLMPADGGGWIESLTGRRTIYPRSIGDYFDACSYIKSNGVNYIYLGKSYNNDNFDIRLSDINGSFYSIYETQSVNIISVKCP